MKIKFVYFLILFMRRFIVGWCLCYIYLIKINKYLYVYECNKEERFMIYLFFYVNNNFSYYNIGCIKILKENLF